MQAFKCIHKDRKHHAAGLCQSCYNVIKKREWLKIPENRDIENEKNRKYYAKKKQKITSI